MLRRTYLGIDITAGGLYAASMRRAGRSSLLRGARALVPGPGMFAFSPREPNVLDEGRFVEIVQELLNPLAGHEERVSLSLPDRVGRVLLTESETDFKTHEEGVEILKWQLKGSLPDEARDVRLDYQVMERAETGLYRIVVSLISRKVLEQYEALLSRAGYGASVVDFHSMNLHSFYRPRLDLGEDFILVGVEGESLSLLFFTGRRLAFCRVKDVASDPSTVFHEVNRSLVGLREGQPAFRRASVFLHCDREGREALQQALQSLFEREVVLLDPRLDRMVVPGTQLPRTQPFALVAAIGAAERMM